MGREHLDDYFWYYREKETSPLTVGYEQNSESGLYRLIVIDNKGIKVIDFEEFDLEKVRREAGFLKNSLELKCYKVELRD